jgi:hypothetical protein
MFSVFKVKPTVQKLLRDQAFVDYCRQEIHNILNYGHITKEDLGSIMNIILYIFKNNPNHNVSKDIFADVLEAFVIELLKKYGITLSGNDYENIREWIRNHVLKSNLNLVERIFRFGIK